LETCLIIDAVIGVRDIFSTAYDVIAFWRSRGNRKARREARRTGEIPPEKNTWTRRFCVLTFLSLTLTGCLAARKLW